MTRPWRLGVFTVNDLRGYSGIPHAMVRTFRAARGVEVALLPAGRPYRPRLGKRVLRGLERRLFGRDYLWEKEPARCRSISAAIDRAAEAGQVDAVLLYGSESCAFCRTAVPLFCYASSLFGSRIDMYPDHQSSRIHPASLREGVQVQQGAIDRLERLFLSSRWTLDRAVARFGYRIPEGRVEVVGIGANLPGPPPVEPESAGDAGPLRLLWVGNFWERKGGEFAVRVVAGLRARGIDARLDVVGGVRPAESHGWLALHGRLDYERAEDYELLRRLYRGAQAVLLPTTGDLTPLGICESYAFSRPVCATPVGAIPELVEDGRTGLLLERDSPERWADRIAAGWRAGEFVGMRRACRRRYEERLNWERVCAHLLDVMRGGGR